MCRYLPLPGTCESFVGVDVDGEAIRWNARHIPRGDFVPISPLPPTPLPSASFDVIYAVSVFTHLDEAPQFLWLEELTRVLRPGGLLMASTHSEQLAPTRSDLSPSQLTRLATDGFAFAPGGGSFNDNTAFHSRSYLERNWSRSLALLGFYPHGLFHYQDLSVWTPG
jgi:SAM-dependent methyltransferase